MDFQKFITFEMNFFPFTYIDFFKTDVSFFEIIESILRKRDYSEQFDGSYRRMHHLIISIGL